MNVFRFRGSQSTLSEREAAALCQVCARDEAELRRRVATREPVVEIGLFMGEWLSVEARVLALFDGIATGGLPLVVSEYASDEDGIGYEKCLTLDQARARLQFFRMIALLRVVPMSPGGSE
jgi:hypothetical protein